MIYQPTAFKLEYRVLFAIGIVFMAGCGDPVRTTSQPVLMRVTNSTSGEPIADVNVSLKYDFDHYVPKTDEWNEWKRSTYRWFSGKTNMNGDADVGIVWTRIDRTIGSTPPSWRDDVTGKSYLIGTKKDQLHEEHSLIIRPDASVQGEFFTVRVLEVRKPQYVKTK